MSIILILIALGAGLFIGRRFEGAHDAHQRYSSYRARTSESFGSWFRNTIISSISILCLILALYFLLFHFHIR